VNHFTQLIKIVGNAGMDLDRLEAIADLFKREIIREGGNTSDVIFERSTSEVPNGLEIHVNVDAEIWSPDGAFRFNSLGRGFTIECADPMVAFYRRNSLIGEIQNHLLRGLTAMTVRLASGDYVPDPAQWTVAEYIKLTNEAVIATLPNMAAGR